MPKQKINEYKKQINVRVTEEEYELVLKRAREKGITVSKLVRLLLTRR